jgi:glycosyltransferase involved in cell wall biosynthesis
MPVYNAAPYLREAIDSIVAQTFENWELIVLNDGSSDDSLQIAGSYTDPRIKVLDSKINQGLIYQLNRGIDAARGHYIARLDADDVALPGRLQRQFDYLEKYPEIGLLGGRAAVVGSDEVLAHSEYRDDILIELLHRNAFIHSTVMFRTAVYRAVSSGFNEAYKHAEDYHLWQLFALHTGVKNLDDVLIQYRMHAQQVSKVHAGWLESSANKVRLEYISAALKTDLSEYDGRVHLALIFGAEESIAPAVVQRWVKFIKKKNTFFPEISFNHFVDSRFKTYVRGYFLWNLYCKRPIHCLKQLHLIFGNLTLLEITSVMKKSFVNKRNLQPFS